MRRVNMRVIVTCAGAAFAPTAASAQNQCVDPRVVPPGTYPTCGYGPGQYRPQPYTLRGTHLVPTPYMMYAPSGSRQQYWNQLDTRDGTYGPREPNPFGANGRLDPFRAFNHVLTTRVRPWIRRHAD